MTDSAEFKRKFSQGFGNKIKNIRHNYSKDNMHMDETFSQNHNGLSSKDLADFEGQSCHVIKTKNPQHFFQFGTSCSQLVKVLLQQNQNLKQQNLYLQKQLNKFILKQKDLSETVIQYQTIMSVLNAQNVKLHQEILEFSQHANNKVDKLKTTINHFFKNKNQTKHQNIYEEEDTFTMAPSYEDSQEDQRFRRNRSEKGFGNIGRSQRIQSKALHTNHSTRQFSQYISPLQQYQYPFDQMLQQCRSQPNPQKRRNMRRKLVELAYKQSQTC